MAILVDGTNSKILEKSSLLREMQNSISNTTKKAITPMFFSKLKNSSA